MDLWSTHLEIIETPLKPPRAKLDQRIELPVAVGLCCGIERARL